VCKPFQILAWIPAKLVCGGKMFLFNPETQVR
jgi:hypothetical protein